MKKNEARLDARIPIPLKEALKITADKEDRSVASLIIFVLRRYCEQAGAFDELRETHNPGDKSE